VGTPPADGEPKPGAAKRLVAVVSVILKLGVFVLVFQFALRNNEPLTLRLVPGYDWTTSVALALVGALCAGALLGVLAMSGHALALRRRASRAERELALARERSEPVAAGPEPARGV